MNTPNKSDNQTMDTVDRIFHALDTTSSGYILKHDLKSALLDRGIIESDPRIRQTIEGLKKYSENDHINGAAFRQLVSPHITLIEKALTGNLVIPDFKNFASFITNLYNRTLQNEEGRVSDYLPELAKVDPSNYALSVCTVDGQRFNIGDFNKLYLARETAKVLNYCLAFEEYDEQAIHERVGRSAKENGFDYLMLNTDGQPHNPLTGSGALMISSMLGQTKPGDRFLLVRKIWQAMAGGLAPTVNDKALHSEKSISDADRALAYYMQQKGLFAKGSNIDTHLDFLWRCYAIETTTEAQAVIAATLANAGVCPSSEQEVIKPATARNCLAIMALAGMKEAASEYAFSIGLPAISGSSGVVMIVVPDVMGIAIWSPHVDKVGNGVKGLDFSHKFVERFNFHTFDSAIKNIGKIDPRLKKNETKMKGVMAVTAAASLGDLDELQRLYAAGVDLNEGEYDKRTGIHLAASEGHLEAVQFLIDKNVDINPKDRWGGTPLADAKREGHKAVEELLKKHGGTEKA
jgi:glutaminase